MRDNDGWHSCHSCGTEVKDGYEYNGDRHFLSDCRPDLVEHEIGDTCTWAFRRKPIEVQDSVLMPLEEEETCYAYQDPDTRKLTKEHKYFYTDGPM